MHVINEFIVISVLSKANRQYENRLGGGDSRATLKFCLLLYREDSNYSFSALVLLTAKDSFPNTASPLKAYKFQTSLKQQYSFICPGGGQADSGSLR